MVVDRGLKLKGIIGASDIKEGSGQKAGDCYKELPDYVTDNATLNDALSVMLECGEGYVAVVDEAEQYLGTITLGDLLRVVREDNDVA